jgi:hypothetical protein
MCVCVCVCEREREITVLMHVFLKLTVNKHSVLRINGEVRVNKWCKQSNHVRIWHVAIHPMTEADGWVTAKFREVGIWKQIAV